MTVYLYAPDDINNTPTEVTTVNSEAELKKVCMDFFAEDATNFSEFTILSGKNEDGFYEKVFLEKEEDFFEEEAV